MDRRPLRVLSLSFPKRSLFKLGLIGGLAVSHFHDSLLEHCWETEPSPWMLCKRWRTHAPGAAPPTQGNCSHRAPAALPTEVREPRDGRATAVAAWRSLLGAVSIHKKHRNILSSVLSLPLCYSKADPAALTSTTPWGDDLQDHFHLTFLVSCTTTGIAVGCRSNVSRTHRSLLSQILA